MKLNPLNDRVIIKPETKPEGLIVIPDEAKDKPTVGEVIAAGPGITEKNGNFRATTVKPGDRVLYGKYHGFEVDVDGQKLFTIKESEIIGIIG